MKRINEWLARLKIAHKLALSGLFFALPIAVLLTYVTRQYDRGIRTCEREVAGTRILELCPALLHDLRALEIREDFTTRNSIGGPNDLAELRARIDKAMRALQGAEGGGTQEFVGRLSGLWREVQERGQALPAQEKAALYHQMVDTASQLVSAILDDSSLILDSELRTYYVMNLSGPLLLQAQAVVAESEKVALKANAEQRPLDRRDLSQLQNQSEALAGAIIPRMRYALETAVRADKQGASSSFQRNVPELFERYAQRVSDLSSSIRDAEADAGPASARDRIAAAAAAADDAGVSLGSTAVSELRTLLAGRIAGDKRSRAVAWLMSLLCVALAAVVMTAVTLNVTRPINFVAAMTADIAAGRVKEAFHRQQRGEFRRFLPRGDSARTRDEICHLINSVCVMTASLDTLLAKIVQASNQVSASATQMAAAVRQVEAAVSEQAASTEQVSATSKEIGATAREFARTMAAITSRAEEAAGEARGGVTSLEGIRSALDELIHASATMTQTFNSISERTGNIDKIILAITKVANRTNLLSLNAAIEAEKEEEKAGGFSVVAVEMTRLADQTAVAALDIEAQIRNMQRAVRDGISSVESYAGQTRAKSTAVAELSSGLEHVIEHTTQLAPEFEAVNKGVQLQSEGASQIAEAMEQLRQAAGQTRDSLAEFRQVAADLQSAVRDMQAEVGRFAIAS